MCILYMDTMFAKGYTFLVMAVIFNNVLTNDLTLTPDRVYVQENSRATLTCSKTAGLLKETRWNNSQINEDANLVFFNGKCIANRFLNDSEYFEGVCNGNGTYTVVLKMIHRTHHGSEWTCKETDSSLSNSVSIYVTVPVTSVELIQNRDYMIENHTEIVTCITSASRPEPRVQWYLSNSLSEKVNLTRFSTAKNISENGLVAVNSTLQFKQNRTVSGWRLYCEVWTQNDKADRTSKEIIVNITYPPNGLPKIQGFQSIGSFKAIESDTGYFVCSVTGGNPLATLNWTCFGSYDKTFKTIGNTVSSTINWKAHRKYDLCFCQAQHLNNWTRTTNVSITVQFPPDIPTINASNINGSTIDGQEKSISIIEFDTVHLTCFSNSKPLPLYQWLHGQTSAIQRENVLKFQNITRNDTGTYTCEVQNIMNRSNGTTQKGKNESKTYLNILYPAIVGDIEDISVVEGSRLYKVCPIVSGNPSNSTVVWSRNIDHSRWDGKHLNISVSRKDDSNYTCCVTSYLLTNLGDYLEVKKTKSFHLNVFFQCKITTFSLTESNETLVVINKMDIVTLKCISEANPSSNLTISSPSVDNIVEVSNSNIARHTIQNSTYVDAGQYTCTGRNNYTRGLPAKSHLILIVRCPPRPSSDEKSVEKVETCLNVNFTLNFSAMNYLDETNKTKFNWFKDNASLPDDSNTYIVHSNGLQTNISIINVTRHDLGLYRVIVKNTAGTYIHCYNLTAADIPDPPTDFLIMNNSILDKSVTLAWSSGFNGGFQQTFIILYKPKLERLWKNKSVADTGIKNMNFTLNGLSSLRQYEVLMFSKNKVGNSSRTHPLKFQTKAPLTNSMNPTTIDQTSTIAGTLSGLTFVVIVLAIAGVVFFFRKRLTRENIESDNIYQNVPFIGNATTLNPKPGTKLNQTKAYNSRTEETVFKGKQKPKSSDGDETWEMTIRKEGDTATNEIIADGLQEIDDIPIYVNERTEYCNSPDEINKIQRITIMELFAYVNGNTEDLEIEYQKLPTGLLKPYSCARRPENIALNRYNGIYPYDHSRVTIPEQPDFFINACYIDGYKRKKAYIASLGPTKKTSRDFKTFWEMIWHEKSDVIIMLTNLHEASGMKCQKYWPDNGTKLEYGDVLVTSKTTEVFAEYTVRTFGMTKGNQKRSLTHLHYTSWPDKTVPQDVTSLLEFREIMKDVPSTHKGPIVIHCSAGIGRTGTLIALDILIEEGLDLGSVNVFECVQRLREQRVKMVQTFEQYVYIHKALVNALSFECASVARKGIPEYIGFENKRHYNELFQELDLSIETDSPNEQKARTRNKSYSNKNRKGADIPGDRFRFYLQFTDGREGSDYINAVYINSFQRKDHFITAQSPLPSTVTDFISMIYHGECSCIVTMEDLQGSGMAVGAYLPEMNKTITFGNYEVTCSKFTESNVCIIRKMEIKYTSKISSGEKLYYHFQYTKWRVGSSIPENAADFVQFAQEVEECANGFGEDRSRVVVHCTNANKRCCLFCAVVVIMEKLEFEGTVNILNVVRHLRTRRRTAIVSTEQLKFCYDVAKVLVIGKQTINIQKEEGV